MGWGFYPLKKDMSNLDPWYCMDIQQQILIELYYLKTRLVRLQRNNILLFSLLWN